MFLSLRCLGTAGESTRGCRRQVTRRRTASCGGVLGERSEGRAVLSVDTRHGTRRLSRRTCKRKVEDEGQSSFLLNGFYWHKKLKDTVSHCKRVHFKLRKKVFVVCPHFLAELDEKTDTLC